LIAGQTYFVNGPDQSDSILIRYNADGSLDAGFGNGGTVVSDFSPISDGVLGLTLPPDGKIVAGGWVQPDAPQAMSLARCQPDGTLDVSFGNGGRVTTDLGPVHNYVQAMAVQPDGRIVAVCPNDPVTGGLEFLLTRFDGYDLSIAGTAGNDTITVGPGALAGT